MNKRTCSIDGCESVHYGRGWCRAHWKRWRRWGDPEHDGKRLRQGVDPCSIPGCTDRFFIRGWCKKHYTRWRRHGDPEHRLRGEVRAGQKVCAGCGVEFPLAEYETYVSRCRPCGRAYHSARSRSRYESKSRFPMTCELCGDEFMGNAKQRRYCSAECAAANKNRANWPYLNARRARLRDALVEVFDRIEIFERDGWMCGICGAAVDRNIAWPDPMSASLDHIVPVSRGGKHARANAQCSHLACNVKKGASAA